MFEILERIHEFFLKKKLLKDYYDSQAEEIMKSILEEDKSYIGVYDRNNRLKELKKLKVL